MYLWHENSWYYSSRSDTLLAVQEVSVLYLVRAPTTS